MFIDLLKKIIRGFFYSLIKINGWGRIVAIGKNVTILGRKKDFHIGSFVKIERGSYIQTISKHGIYFGNNVTIGAGSVVVKDIPDNCIAAGNPAKVIRYI